MYASRRMDTHSKTDAWYREYVLGVIISLCGLTSATKYSTRCRIPREVAQTLPRQRPLESWQWPPSSPHAVCQALPVPKIASENILTLVRRSNGALGSNSPPPGHLISQSLLSQNYETALTSA
jgi:hypothetical protein